MPWLTETSSAPFVIYCFWPRWLWNCFVKRYSCPVLSSSCFLIPDRMRGPCIFLNTSSIDPGNNQHHRMTTQMNIFSKDVLLRAAYGPSLGREVLEKDEHYKDSCFAYPPHLKYRSSTAVERWFGGKPMQVWSGLGSVRIIVFEWIHQLIIHSPIYMAAVFVALLSKYLIMLRYVLRLIAVHRQGHL